jgi:ATP-binding cassette subfamily B (MDR/TAP) protein 1
MAPIGIITAGFLAVVQTIISQILRIRGRKDVKLAEEPSRLASEAFDRHRTIKSLGREKYFSAMFAQLNYKPHKRSVIRGVIQSLTYAFQSGYAFFNFAAAYRFGIFLVHKRISSPYTVFQVIETLNGAPMSMSVFAAYFPEYVRARLSAATILKMLQDRPTIKSPIIRHLDVKKLNSLPELHEVQIENVDFAYPINKDRKVLKHFTANISKGRTIAVSIYNNSI